MSRQQKDAPNITTVKGADGFQRRARALQKQGYVMCWPTQFVPATDKGIGDKKNWGDFVHSQLFTSTGRANTSSARNSVPTLYFSSGNENRGGVEEIGSRGLGYMEWGSNNLLPNVVALLTQILPYTAAGIKFNTDICAGLGPQPMYDIVQYVGGNITTKSIRYKDAGAYLQGRIVDKQRELLNIQEKRTQSEENSNDPSWTDDFGKALQNGEENGTSNIYDALYKSLTDEISQLQGYYEEWKKTWPAVQDFVSRNNLAQIWLSLALDEQMFGICFPELQLNLQALDSNGKPVGSNMWKPNVVGIGYHTCHTTRLERMDGHGIVNYVYCSTRWLDSPFVDGHNANAPIVAIPALNPLAPLQTLEESVRRARERNVAVKNRPTRFVLPSYYPTAGRPYYPTPAWHSIFGGDIYEYISTIISDRYNRKKNSSIIGRVIYIHNDYLHQMFQQQQALNDTKKQNEIRNTMFVAINKWLANRDNAGQSLLAFTFMGTDGKEHKSYEIVEIQSADSKSADANETETAEISSIVFMALGLDARLLGSSPLSLVNAGSGTDIRERLLMRQILMSPTQNVMLKCLDVVSRFNKWDSHLVWKVQREVMTTLDRNKSGISSDTDNQQ